MIQRVLSVVILFGIIFGICVLVSELTHVNPVITIVALLVVIGIILSVIAIYVDLEDEDDAG